MRIRASNRRWHQRQIGAMARSILVATVVVLLVGCGARDDSNPTPTVLAATTAPLSPTTVSTPATPVALSTVVFATGIDATTGGPAQELTEVPETAKTIYAFVQAGPLPVGTTITADWTIDGTPIPGVSQSVQVNHAREAGWIEFHLDWTADGTWPRGALGVTIAVDGASASEATGSVKIVPA